MKPLHCPFCGSKSKVISSAIESYSGRDDTYYDVSCTNDDCYLSGGADWRFDTPEEAIEKWNYRPIREKKLKRILG